jgi:hypothetical protein
MARLILPVRAHHPLSSARIAHLPNTLKFPSGITDHT